MNKKKFTLGLAGAATVLTLGACGARGGAAASGESADTSKSSGEKLIGGAIYKFDDTFMTGVRTAMTDAAKEAGVKLELVDSQNKQPTQNEQVDTFITKGVQALAVNPVDRTAAGPIIEKAKAKDLPIVFINREP